MNFTFPNSSLNDTFSETKSNLVWSPLIYAVLFILDFVHFTNNVIILFLIYKKNKIKTMPARLLANGAFADGCLGLYFIGQDVYELVIQPDKEHLQVSYTILRVFVVAMYSESLQTMGATAFSLYLAICHPVKYKIYNETKNLVIFLASTWIINAIVGCLIFAAGDAFVHEDLMIISFYRMNRKDIWYSTLKTIVMFSESLLSIYSFIRVLMYKRAMNRGEELALPAKKALISQCLGIIFLNLVNGIFIIALIIIENVSPISAGEDTSDVFIGQAVMYIYLALKLPLFLLAFKPYRKVAMNLWCSCLPSNQVQPEHSLHHERPAHVATVGEMVHQESSQMVPISS